MSSRPALLAAAAIAASTAHAGELVIDYLYRLSDFSGTVPFELPHMAVDRERGELLVAEAESVTIFGSSGMAVHEFEHDVQRLGVLLDVAALPEGEILLLSKPWVPAGEPDPTLLTHCDFRGRPRESFEIANLPEDWSGFAPDVLRYRGGKLYVASLVGRRVAEVEVRGGFVEGWDLGALLGSNTRSRSVTDLDLGGFDVGPDGRFVVSAPVLGFGYRIARDGTVESFGATGSARGAIGIGKGVAVTDAGWILVADILNQVVLVFDDTLEFIADFPARRGGPEALAGPSTLAAAPDGRVFVGELGGGGIAVFRLGERAETP